MCYSVIPKTAIPIYFIKNIDSYNKFICEYEKYEGKRIKSGLYSMVVDYDIKKVQEDMKTTYKDMITVYAQMRSESLQLEDEINETRKELNFCKKEV